MCRCLDSLGFYFQNRSIELALVKQIYSLNHLSFNFYSFNFLNNYFFLWKSSNHSLTVTSFPLCYCVSRCVSVAAVYVLASVYVKVEVCNIKNCSQWFVRVYVEARPPTRTISQKVESSETASGSLRKTVIPAAVSRGVQQASPVARESWSGSASTTFFSFFLNHRHKAA